VGWALPDDFQVMEVPVGGTDTVLQISRDDQESDLHDQRDRVAQLRDWGSAMNQFAILYGDRVPL